MRRNSLRKGSSKDGQGAVEHLDSPPCYDDACQTPATPESRIISMPKLKASHVHFLHWVAYHRKFWPTISEEQKRTCPIKECDLPPFETVDDMQQHLCVCKYLRGGTYVCVNCDNDERTSKYHANTCLQPRTMERVKNSFRSAKSSARKIFSCHEPRVQQTQGTYDQFDLQLSPTGLPTPTNPIVSELPSYEGPSSLAEMEAVSMAVELDNYPPYSVPQDEPRVQFADFTDNQYQSTMADVSLENAATPISYGYPNLPAENSVYCESYNVAQVRFGTDSMNDTSNQGDLNHWSTSALQAHNLIPEWDNTANFQPDIPAIPPLHGNSSASWGTPRQPFHYEEASDQNGFTPQPFNIARRRENSGRDSVSSMGSYLSQGTRGYSMVSSMGSVSSRNTSGIQSSDMYGNQVKIFNNAMQVYDEPEEMLEIENLAVAAPFGSSLADLVGLVFNENDEPSKSCMLPMVPIPQYLSTPYAYKPSTPSLPSSPDTAVSDSSTPESSAPQTPPAIRRYGPSTRISKSRSVTQAKIPSQCKCGYAPKGPSNLSRHRNTCPAQAPHFIKRKVHLCSFPGCERRFTRSDNLRFHQTKKGHLATIELPVIAVAQLSISTDGDCEVMDDSYELYDGLW